MYVHFCPGLIYGPILKPRVSMGSPYTVIYFQNFGFVRVFEVLLLIFDFQAYRWSSWVSRITGKMKKANKGCEGQTKARESTMPKFYDFFISTGSFGVLYLQI